MCLPQDVQGEAYDYPTEFLQKRVHHIQRRDIETLALKRVIELIAGSKKPLIVCGGGVKYSDAAKELQELSEVFKIPFGETQAGKGAAVLWSCPMNMGGIGTTGTSSANRLALEADLMIGIGTRLNDFHTCSSKSAVSES